MVSKYTVAEGLVVLNSRAVDVALVDLHLERGPNGDKLLEAAQRWHRGVVRILLTADDQGHVIAKQTDSIWIDRREPTAVMVEALRAALG